MSATNNRKVVLRRVPEGMPKPSDFEIVPEELPAPGPGQMLLRTRWLTLDPYMRSTFMNSADNEGRTVIGGTVSEVTESHVDGWNDGDLVVGYYGWQEQCLASASDVQWNNPGIPIQKWDGSLGPASTALGILGMTGYTAYQGLLKVAKVKAGETVVVSAASGAVGQVVGQLAKIKGARAVGIAGGPAKCAWCVDEAGFDACIDYKAPNFATELANAAPDGVDVYFENVGGDVLEAVIPLLNPGCRVPICGFIAHYNLTGSERRPTPLQRLKAEGLPVLPQDGNDDGAGGYRFFAFSELAASHPAAEEALEEMSGWIKHGRLKYRESVTEGLDGSIDAFIGMLQGSNFGKAMVRL
ncbi:MAG: NADP-dependent oxidoreductase [Gammaproteobacteria bacterium]|nr:NADP-dependent oxidoreductase [Gammaproteobacteria bacterium]